MATMLDEHIDYLKNNLGRNIPQSLFERFKELITSGKLSEGTLLPAESILCEMLGIGRSTLREAYTALSVLGLIKRTKTGTYINQISSVTSVAPFKLNADKTNLEDLLEFRLMLEEKTANYAAQRRTDEDLLVLEEYFNQMVSAFDDVNKFIKHDILFHYAIAKSTHNDFLIGTMEAAREPFEKSIYNVINKSFELNKELMGITIDFHEKILNAIGEKDWRRASTEMRAHIAYANLTVKC